MLDSASVNSISSMPSPVYQWRKAFLLNIAVNCSEILLKSSWMAVEFPIKVAAILRPLGGISHTAVLTLLGIHSTKYDEFLFWMFSICSSTSFMDMRPRKTAATVRYLPCLGSQAAIMFLASNICCVSSGTVRALYCWDPLAVRGANPGIKKWRRGKGTMLTASFLRSALSCPGNLRQVVTPGIVRLNNCVRHLWGRNYGVGIHDSVRVFFSNLGNQEGTHTWTSTTSKGVSKLKS